MTNAPHGREVGPPVYELTPGERLAKARRNTNISTAEMAELLGVTDRTIRNYENDVTPIKRSAFITYAWHTGYDLDWLETGETPSDGPDPGVGTVESTHMPTYAYSWAPKLLVAA